MKEGLRVFKLKNIYSDSMGYKIKKCLLLNMCVVFDIDNVLHNIIMEIFM